jgi:hypothetical protein
MDLGMVAIALVRLHRRVNLAAAVESVPRGWAWGLA